MNKFPVQFLCCGNHYPRNPIIYDVWLFAVAGLENVSVHRNQTANSEDKNFILHFMQPLQIAAVGSMCYHKL
jgi:hypothetical protein